MGTIKIYKEKMKTIAIALLMTAFTEEANAVRINN